MQSTLSFIGFIGYKELNSNTVSWNLYTTTNSKPHLWLSKIRSKAFASCCSLELIWELVIRGGNKKNPNKQKQNKNSDASSMELCPTEIIEMYNVHKVQILLLLELQEDKRSSKSGGNQTFYKICRLQPSYHISLINLEAIFNILMECFPGQPHQSYHPVAKQYFKLIHYKCLASKWEMGIKSSPDGTCKIQKCEAPLLVKKAAQEVQLRACL